MTPCRMFPRLPVRPSPLLLERQLREACRARGWLVCALFERGLNDDETAEKLRLEAEINRIESITESESLSRLYQMVAVSERRAAQMRELWADLGLDDAKPVARKRYRPWSGETR